MIDKNKIFDLLIDGKWITISNNFQRSCLNRFNDIMICREFKWTFEDIGNLEQEAYNDIILILQKEQFKQQQSLKSKK